MWNRLVEWVNNGPYNTIAFIYLQLLLMLPLLFVAYLVFRDERIFYVGLAYLVTTFVVDFIFVLK